MDRKTITDIVELTIQKVALASELKEFKVSDELSYFASDLNTGSIITDKDGGVMANTEFEIDGTKYATDDMGALKEVTIDEPVDAPAEPIALEDAPIDTPVDADPIDAPIADDSQILKDQITEMEAKIKDMETTIADLEAKNVKLEADLVLTESEKVAMSNDTPASEGILDVPVVSNDTEVKKGLLSTLRKLDKK